jgi:hypothetical protein
MLFISTGIFDDKLRPQILSIGTTANSGKNKKQRQMFVVFVNNISYVIAEKKQIRNNTVENSMFNNK